MIKLTASQLIPQRETKIQYQTFFIPTKERMIAFLSLILIKKCRNLKENILIQPVSPKVRRSPETELDLLFCFPIQVCLGFLVYFFWV